MKTIIIYATTHGCTEKTALQLKHYLADDVTLVNLNNQKTADIASYDRVIIGGSIHAGQIQKRVKTFCKKYLSDLKSSELGLFICCMEEGATAQQQLLNAYPEELLREAKTTAVFGGEFDFNKMNFFQKWVVKKVAKVDQNVSKMDNKAISHFSEKMERVFNPFLFLA